jgi:hypothetical protein
LVAPLLATLSLATADSLKMKEWVKRQLGFFRKEVDQALVGLTAGMELKPNEVQNIAELVYGSIHGPVHGLVNVSVHGPVHGSDLSDPLPAASFLRLSVQDISLGSEIHRELGFT